MSPLNSARVESVASKPDTASKFLKIVYIVFRIYQEEGYQSPVSKLKFDKTLDYIVIMFGIYFVESCQNICLLSDAVAILDYVIKMFPCG